MRELIAGDTGAISRYYTGLPLADVLLAIAAAVPT